MEKVKLKQVVIKNVGVVRDGSLGSWVKVQIGRLGATEHDNLIGIISKASYYKSAKDIRGTIECIIWIPCSMSFVSAGDIFYGDVEFSIAGDIQQAIDLDSFTTDATATYSWEFPDDMTKKQKAPKSSYKLERKRILAKLGQAEPGSDEETTFTLLSVAIKTREVVQGHSEIYGCKIRIGRMSETEKTKLESFVRRIGARSSPISMSMVEGGKTIPGTREPLHTYEMYVCMATCPPPVVDACDLEFKYIAEKDMILAGIVDVYAPHPGLRGVNWFNAQMEGGEASDEIKSFVATHARYIARRNGSRIHATKAIPIPEIEKIEFNEPATIIFWKDGTKSIVKARDGEPYDAEKGIAMAIAKKVLGNQHDYYNTFIHWLKRYKKKLNAAPREKYVAPQLEILDDRITENPKKSSAKKKTTSKKGGKR